MSSQYASRLAERLDGVPADVGRIAESSVGAAVQISGELPRRVGVALSAAAKSAFVDAMGIALIVGAVVALVAAALVGRYLPGGAHDRRETEEAPEPAPADPAPEFTLSSP
jgi:hypothetical protein